MPRTARSIEAGMVDHVLNRGNGLLRLFHNEADYDACERVLVEGLERYPVDLLTYCLMPNHWHVVVRPRTDVALGRLMGWMGVTHVRRHHVHDHRRGAGHLDQGRFKSLPVAEAWQKWPTTFCQPGNLDGPFRSSSSRRHRPLAAMEPVIVIGRASVELPARPG